MKRAALDLRGLGLRSPRYAEGGGIAAGAVATAKGTPKFFRKSKRLPSLSPLLKLLDIEDTLWQQLLLYSSLVLSARECIFRIKSSCVRCSFLSNCFRQSPADQRKMKSRAKISRWAGGIKAGEPGLL